MDYNYRLTTFLRISGRLVDRFEQIAPDVDGKTDLADMSLIKTFRARLDDLSRSRQSAEPARQLKRKRD
jgi:hypothetical protein